MTGKKPDGRRTLKASSNAGRNLLAGDATQSRPKSDGFRSTSSAAPKCAGPSKGNKILLIVEQRAGGEHSPRREVIFISFVVCAILIL